MAFEKTETLQQRVAHKQRIVARLRLAATRLTDAQLERTWAIVSAHEQGLTIRQIASATDLSAARVHQLLTTPDARDIPRWLNYLREGDGSDDPPHSQDRVPQQPQESLVTQLSAEVTALRQCISWLERLEQGKQVVVNLRLETDPQTEYVTFDGERIQRILGRIAADVEELAHRWGGEEEAQSIPSQAGETKEARHRRKLAEPPGQKRRLSPREERALLRAEAGLPPQ